MDMKDKVLVNAFDSIIAYTMFRKCIGLLAYDFLKCFWNSLCIFFLKIIFCLKCLKISNIPQSSFWNFNITTLFIISIIYNENYWKHLNCGNSTCVYETILKSLYQKMYVRRMWAIFRPRRWKWLTNVLYWKFRKLCWCILPILK